MIDTKELRMIVQDFKLDGSPVFIQTKQMEELLDRLEAAEKERDALRAKIETMEKQGPAAWMSSRNGFICKENKNPDYNVPLYALPGAKGEEK